MTGVVGIVRPKGSGEIVKMLECWLDMAKAGEGR